MLVVWVLVLVLLLVSEWVLVLFLIIEHLHHCRRLSAC
jgi:hypothetical protein